MKYAYFASYGAAICLFLLSGCGTPDGKSHNPALRFRGIYNGTNTSHSSVALLSDNVLGNKCSTVFLGERCAVTAAHCVTPGMNLVYRQDTPNGNSSRIEVLRSVKRHSGAFNPDLDLAVLWLRPDECVGVDCTPVADWFVMPFAQAFPTSETATIVGYGRTNGNAGSGTKRAGIVKIDPDLTVDAGTEGGGGRVHLYEHTDFEAFACAADSGGPVIKNGTVYGIMSGSTAFNNCAPSPTGFHEMEAASFTNGNGGWLSTQLSDFCTPKVMIHAQVTAPQTGVVRCTDWETQVVFETDNQDGFNDARNNTFTLTAIPNSGFRFQKWGNGERCPCRNSTFPVCTINPLELEPEIKDENVWCEAIFEVDVPPTPDPTPEATPVATDVPVE